MKRYFSTHKGFSIIELLVVVAIIGILAGLVLPNIAPIIAGHRFRTANNDLMAKLRSIRSLAITKGRTLEVIMCKCSGNASGEEACGTETESTCDDGGELKPYFIVKKLEHKEYNLLDESETTNKDLLETLSAGEDVSGFVLFEETEELLHIMPIWYDDGSPDYRVPINFDIQQGTDRRHGLGKIGISGTGVTNRIVFYPSGTVEKNVVITLEAPPQYYGIYELHIFRAGQIRGKV